MSHPSSLRKAILLFVLIVGTGCLPVPQSGPPTAAVPDLTAYPWVDLSNLGWESLEDEGVVSLVAVGDVLLGRGIVVEDDPLRDAAPWLAEADLTLGNLEGVLASGGEPRRAEAGGDQPIILQGQPAGAGLLARSGFDLLGLANNHSLDLGPQGLHETAEHLRRAGMEPFGLEGEDWVLREMKGVRLAFLAFNALPDPFMAGACPVAGTCSPQPRAWDPVQSPAAIRAADEAADGVIVSIHWGYEYQLQPDPFQEEMAEQMLAAGADLVVGHHSHVVQRVMVREEGAVAFSLGNFLFDQEGEETARGLALHAFFDRQGLRGLRLLPLRAGLQPRLLPLSEAETWLSRLYQKEARIAFSCAPEACTAVEAPKDAPQSRFFAGQIDLTGDGKLETVRKAGERITIYEAGTAVWHSPEAWRVVDVALGDPNDDGRFEIMLAIRQVEEAGYERSQPYLVGYRGGRFDLLWGGRPVADPIRELEVGDVDGDGIDELVVIEETADGSAQAVSIWRWAGWTFSKVWRSPLGAYSELALIGEESPFITVLMNNNQWSMTTFNDQR